MHLVQDGDTAESNNDERGLASGKTTHKLQSGLTSTQVFDELAKLLTRGRLCSEKRALLQQICDQTFQRAGEIQQALTHVQQLILLAPEFHTNDLSQNHGDVIISSTKSVQASNKSPHKAVICVMLDGEFDSFNMLVPRVCHGRNADGTSIAQQCT